MVGALILMLLAVASGVVVYAYVMGWLGGATGTTAIPGTGASITVQSVAYLEVSHTMTEGYVYEVKVTCKDGTAVSQSVEAK